MSVSEKEWIDTQAAIVDKGSPALKAAQATYQALYQRTDRKCWTGGAREIICAAWRAETGQPLPLPQPEPQWIVERLDWLTATGNPWKGVQSRFELMQFLPFLKSRQPKTILEIGVRTASNLYNMAACLAPGGKITGLDINVPRSQCFAKLQEEKIKTEFVQGDSANLSTIFRGRKFDFIFIDGDHSYAAAKRDFEQALMVLAPGGLIGFHDIAPIQKKEIRVYQLWNEIKHAEVFSVMERQDTCGIGIIDPAKLIPVLPPPVPPLPPPDRPTATTDNGKRILMMVNGGLGDAVGITYAIVAAVKLGYMVDAYAISGNSKIMALLWVLMPGVRAVDRAMAEETQYYAVLCSTNQGTLEERAKGLKYQILSNGNPSNTDTIVGNHMRLLEALGHNDILPPDAPLKPLLQALKPDERQNAILIGPGVGKPAVNKEKLIAGYRWIDIIRYLPRPVKLVGDASAADPWQNQLAEFKDVENLIGKTQTLQDLLPILATAMVYYGPDNGIGHLAAACGIPTVTLFNGATDPKRFAPHGQRALTVEVSTTTKAGELANCVHRIIAPENFKPCKQITDKLLSVVIATHNEGDEVALTCEDVIRNAGCPVEIIIVDDASTDRSCDKLPAGVKVIRRKEKNGVASSRNLGAASATGCALMFLDAHQRVSPQTPAKMMLAALSRGEIIVPGVAALYNPARSAVWSCKWDFKDGRIRSVWHGRKPRNEFEPSQSFVAPGWCLSRETWDKIGPWPASLSNWGSTEVCKGIQAFMCGVKITAMRDAVTWHRFRSRFPYHVGPKGIVANALRVARICFDSETFGKFLLPRMQSGTPSGHWYSEHDDLLKSAEVLRDAEMFAKRRTVFSLDFIKQYFPDWIPA